MKRQTSPWLPICSALSRSAGISQSNGDKNDASHAFYLCPVFPSFAGGGRQGMGDKSQPIGTLIQFAPATDIGIPSHQEIDGALKLVRPVSTRRDGALAGVDVNNRAGRDHRIQSKVAFPDDASQIGSYRLARLQRKQGGF